MKKINMKNTHAPLIVAGYSLFLLLIAATLLGTTIPFGMLLFNPKVMHYNVIVTLVALTIGALLPAIIGYIIGNRAVKTKNKSSRHFTGVLFGLLSYWIMISLTVLVTIPIGAAIESKNVDLIVANIIPSLAVAAAAIALAVAHSKSRHAKKEILQYKPFAFTLIIVTIGFPLLPLIQNLMLGTVSLYAFLPLSLMLIAGIISYASLRRTKRSETEKMAWMAVSVSVLFVAAFVLPQIITMIAYVFTTHSMTMQNVVEWLGLASAVLCWSIYWLKQARTLR